jgi:hypothetical protein
VTTDALADNRCRYPGPGQGFYEVWFATLNDPVTGCGFWFRYTLDQPLGAPRPVPGLWACFFDPGAGSRPFGLRRELPAESWRPPTNARAPPFAVDAAVFDGERLRGSVQDGGRAIDWDLRLEPAPEAFQHVDQRARKLFKPRTLICAPNLAVPFSGVVHVNGRELVLDRAPGCQQHIWGSKHAERWAWAHCNAFDGEPGTTFEGLAASPRKGPFTLPLLTLALLHHRGQEFRFNQIARLVSAHNDLGDYAWRMQTGDGRHRVVIEARSVPERMLQVEYPDPDGNRSFCINTEIASMSVFLEGRRGRLGLWETMASLTSSGTTHFELGAREQRPGIPLL